MTGHEARVVQRQSRRSGGGGLGASDHGRRPGADGRLGVGPGSTTVEIDLVQEAGTTTLRLVHHGLPPETVPDHQQGWVYFLDILRDTLSTG